MRKFFFLAMLLPVLAFCQSSPVGVGDTYAVEKTLATNTVDTIYFALPPEFGWAGYSKTDTTTGFNVTGTKPLAQRFRWSGNAKLSVIRIAGNAADSVRLAVFSVTKYINTDGSQAVLGDANSITYLAGSASTYSSVVGNGSSNAFTITGNLDPSPAIGVIISNLDLLGGNRRYRFALTPL